MSFQHLNFGFDYWLSCNWHSDVSNFEQIVFRTLQIFEHILSFGHLIELGLGCVPSSWHLIHLSYRVNYSKNRSFSFHLVTAHKLLKKLCLFISSGYYSQVTLKNFFLFLWQTTKGGSRFYFYDEILLTTTTSLLYQLIVIEFYQTFPIERFFTLNCGSFYNNNLNLNFQSNQL
jgi:hypothetical protein